MKGITIIGGGIAGLTAAISCAEQGAPVRLLEAHAELGGWARSTSGPYKANLGPHAVLAKSPMWSWLGERELIPPQYARPCRVSAFAGGTTSGACRLLAPP